MSSKLAKIIADFKTSLAVKLTVGATTGSLQSATDDDGVALPTGTYFFTLDGDSTVKEHIVATLTGVNLTDIKSVSRQGVQTTGVSREHRIGASVIISDFAHIKYLNDLLDGTTDLNASEPLAYDADPDLTGNNKKLATVKLVEDTAMAGGVDASTSVKGITKLSVAPVSATNPIAVGQNDPKLPPVDTSTLTTGKVDALAGTSGTPSSTNKYVTNDDTATSGAGKVLRLDGSGYLPALNGSQLTEISLIKNYIAGENITAGNAVTAGYYQADGGITFDALAEKNGSVVSGGGTVTQSFTVANHTNRVLILALNVQATGVQDPTTVTFNGVAMTNVLSDTYASGTAKTFTYILFAPDVTTANVSVTFASAGGSQAYALAIYSYYNVVQSIGTTGAYDTNGAGEAMTLNITPTVDGAVFFTRFAINDTGGMGSVVNANANINSITTNTTLTTGSSGFVYPKKQITISATGSGGGSYASMGTIELKPITVPTFGAVLKTDGSALANACNLDKANNFIGFATESKNAGETIKVQTNGVYSSLTGLNPFQLYYVSDTNGAIATAAGTVSKKVGKAISATDLLIQHDNT